MLPTPTRQQILSAISEYQAGRKIKGFRKRSNKYVLLHDGVQYSPKYIVALALESCGRVVTPDDFDSDRAVAMLLTHRFEVVTKERLAVAEALEKERNGREETPHSLPHSLPTVATSFPTITGQDQKIISLIESSGLSFCLGNAVLQICQARSPGLLEDLQVARWFLDREISRLSQEGEDGTA